MGMVWVACLSAAMIGVLLATMRSGLARTVGLDTRYVAAGEAVLDPQVAAAPSHGSEPLRESSDAGLYLRVTFEKRVQERDMPDAVGLLRANRERPRRCCPGNCYDEIASTHHALRCKAMSDSWPCAIKS